jgi:hypothetical protein
MQRIKIIMSGLTVGTRTQEYSDTVPEKQRVILSIP